MNTLPPELLPLLLSHLLSGAAYSLAPWDTTTPLSALAHPRLRRGVGGSVDAREAVERELRTFKGVARYWREVARAYEEVALSVNVHKLTALRKRQHTRLRHLELFDPDTFCSASARIPKRQLNKAFSTASSLTGLTLDETTSSWLERIANTLPHQHHQLETLAVRCNSTSRPVLLQALPRCVNLEELDLQMSRDEQQLVHLLRQLERLRYLGLVQFAQRSAPCPPRSAALQLSALPSLLPPLRSLELSQVDWLSADECLAIARHCAPTLALFWLLLGEEQLQANSGMTASLRGRYTALQSVEIHSSSPWACGPMLQEMLTTSPRLSHLRLSCVTFPSTVTTGFEVSSLDTLVGKVGNGVVQRFCWAGEWDKEGMFSEEEKEVRRTPPSSWGESGVDAHFQVYGESRSDNEMDDEVSE